MATQEVSESTFLRNQFRAIPKEARELSIGVLAALVPEMIRIIISAGPMVDWGDICFAPMDA